MSAIFVHFSPNVLPFFFIFLNFFLPYIFAGEEKEGKGEILNFSDRLAKVSYWGSGGGGGVGSGGGGLL